MNRFLLICLLGALHVMGLRKFLGEECSKIAFLIDVSESIRVGPDGYDGPGYLPDIKAGLKKFTEEGNLPSCTCIRLQLITFASQAKTITTGYVTPTDFQDYIDNLDYQINPICDDVNLFAGEVDLEGEQLDQCKDEEYFKQQALSYSNLCLRGTCQELFKDGFCGAYPRCGFTNYEAAFKAAYDARPNYAIIITDGDPTIRIKDLFGDPGYPLCVGETGSSLSDACLSSFCPIQTQCTDDADRVAGRNAADDLKDPIESNTKVIAISRISAISADGIQDLTLIASCPNDPPIPGQPVTCDADDKVDTTLYIAENYAAGLQQSLLSIPRLAICNTLSPVTKSPTRSPTTSPTFIVSRAPSPSTCCNCAPTQSQGLDTQSPTPGRCISDTCEGRGCVCLDVATISEVTEFPLRDICYDAACLDACVNATFFSPTPLSTSRPTRAPTTRQPTRRRNIFLWLLPFLLGLSGRGGAGGLIPQAPNTVVDVYHVIHSGRRLLQTSCGTTNSACPKPIEKWRCVNNKCVALEPCSRTSSTCTPTTYCDYSLSVCRAKATVGQTCVPPEEGIQFGNRTCLDGLFCFSNPNRPEVRARCASAQCIACCPCGGLGSTTLPDTEIEVPITCSPTPALAPIVFGTRAPTTRTPTRKVSFNPWLLLFLFPQLGGSGRYPISQPRPGGGTVVVDIWHIIHARQALFNASADNKECVGIKSNHKWRAGNGVTIGDTCNPMASSAAQCCAMCKEAASCVAWEIDFRIPKDSYCDPNPLFGTKFPCRLISGPDFVSSASDYTPEAITIGFIDKRPTGPQLCSSEADCWNRGASETDEGDGRQWCSDLNGLAPKQCRTICSADNTCVRAQGEDTCFRPIIESGPNAGLLSEYGYCVAGYTNCLCDPVRCNPPFGGLGSRPAFCCDQVDEIGELSCCSGTGVQ